MRALILLCSLTACRPETPDTDKSGSDSAAVTDSGDTAAGTGCETLTWNTEPVVELTTQAELDVFCDSANAVQGDLWVDLGDPVDPITALDGIKCLCEVEGDVNIVANELVAAGPPPPHVTGDIELPILSRIGGSFRVSKHPFLTYVGSLWELQSVGGDLIIEDNPLLAVVAFYALTEVGGAVRISGLDSLTVLRLPYVTSAGRLQIGAEGQALPLVVEVNLDAMQTVDEDLEVLGTGHLSRLSAPALTAVGGDLRFEATCNATPALPALTEARSLRLVGNCGLDDLSGLSALVSLGGTDDAGDGLRVEGNPELEQAELDAFLNQISTAGPAAVEAGGDCAAAITAGGWTHTCE